MKIADCAHVRAWLYRQGQDQLPHRALVEHVVGCPLCRGALVLLLAELGGITFRPDEACSCDSCRHDLAAYVDLVHIQGLLVADQAYPNIWWHRWLCEECAETCDFMVALAADTGGCLAAIAGSPFSGG